MPYEVPTFDDMLPTVEQVLAEAKAFKPHLDGDWDEYLRTTIVRLAGKNLQVQLEDAINTELASYVALYGSVDESDDVAEYWSSFDEELALFFDPLIAAIGVMNYAEALPGHDLSDFQTLVSVCGELAEHIKMTWTVPVGTAWFAEHGYDQITMTLQNNGTATVTLPGGGAAVNVIAPYTPGSPPAPSLAAVKGQPNSQLLGEAFRMMREAFKIADKDIAEHARMSRSTLLNFVSGKVTTIRPDQAAGLLSELDRRIEKLQYAANVLAQVTK